MRWRSIGVIRSPFRALEGMPIQPAGARETRGTVRVHDEYRAGLRDLQGFSHVILLYRFHRSRGYELSVTPFLDRRPRGLFATRAPRRPNPIGLSIVRLDAVRGGTLYVRGIDVLDGTPLLDIKPYVPEFDHPGPARAGWLDRARGRVRTRKSDGRFAGGRARVKETNHAPS